MCGIAGFFANNTAVPWGNSLCTMMDELVHRGPDAGGSWGDVEAGIALGHRRLSILDLSPAGNQPMQSVSGRYVIVFNGEIYNHDKIRGELEQISGEGTLVWRGHSDTEIILAAIDVWGLETALGHFVGMFAIALWDRKERTLHLIRDRLGEKPLYYGWVGEDFVFASELKAMRKYPNWRGDIDKEALCLFLRHNYIPAPYSIYTNAKKLLPGSILTVSKNKAVSIHSYWSAKEVAEEGCKKVFSGSDKLAVDQLHTLLRDSVAQQMVADVSLGAFLSGGIDSSTVVALMQSMSKMPVKTFTIGFEENEYNETEFASAVAKHLGTEHTELYVTPSDALSVIPKLPTLYDEPFADFSQIPTFLICQMTKKFVTVSLSGDGGDELFGGYTRYQLSQQIWKNIAKVPSCGRKILATGMGAIPGIFLDSCFEWLTPVFDKFGTRGRAGDKLHKLAEILAADSQESLYLNLLSHWKNPAGVVIGGSERSTIFTDQGKWTNLTNFTDKMMLFDMVNYLPDDILVKVDRAAMGVSLETRVPFLDHRVAEFAWHVPLSMKIRNGQGKWLLRQVLYKYVPKELIERPKKGFTVPIGEWLRGPLREWAECLLSEKRLQEEGVFFYKPIREKWNEHLSGKRNWQFYLWDILMFQAWLDEQ